MRKLIKKLLSYPSLPDFMIIGAQKSGTTSIDSYLRYHPSLKGGIPKELHFFDNKKIYRRGLSWYKNQFRRLYFEKKKLYYESTPNYLFNQNAPKELQKLNKNLKFIVILRDPIERAFSAYNMFKLNYLGQKKNNQKIQEHLMKYVVDGEFMSFEDTIDKELDRISKGIENEIFDETFTLIRKGLYEEQLEHWYRFFDQKQFLILHFEDLKKDEKAILNRITKFLDVQDFTNIQLDTRPRNKREYSEKISPEAFEKLNRFYKQHSYSSSFPFFDGIKIDQS